MAGETIITIVGNLTADPELRFTPNGAAVANFTVACTPRNLNRQTNEWEDGETLFMRCSIWREAAENAAESLRKGMRVITQGRMVSRSFETKEGERRTNIELQVDEIGPSLKYSVAQVTKSGKSTMGFNSGSNNSSGFDTQGFGAPQAQPAAFGGPAGPGAWDAPKTGGFDSNEPPF